MKTTVGLLVLLLMLTGCSRSGSDDPVATSSEEAVDSERGEEEAGCRPGKPVKIEGGMRIPQSCPTSRPQAVGSSERIRLGSVLAKLPCRELPDFAGSYWRVARPYPRGLAKVGHDDIPGRMTLVSRDKARFRAKAIHMSMGRSKPMMRFPARGRLDLSFERIEGAVAVGGCA